MKKKTCILTVVLIILGGLIWKRWPSASKLMRTSSQKSKDAVMTPGTGQTPSTIASTSASSTAKTFAVNTLITPPPPKGASRDELFNWRLKMQAIDPYYFFHMAISFYGKVLDETGKPVPDAMVKIGVRTKDDLVTTDITTDANGLFAITGQVGATLGISLSKEGYKPYNEKNQYTFDYAAFRTPSAFEADPDNPVPFYLRKDRLAEHLIRSEKIITVSIGNQAVFSLSGSKTATDKNEVVFELLESHGPRDAAWSMKVSVPDGGVQISTEEFPFEAPADGYESSLVIDLKTPKPYKWDGDNRAQLYIKTVSGYARMTLKMSVGDNRLRVASFFNPAGSRDLEFNPEQDIPPADRATLQK